MHDPRITPPISHVWHGRKYDCVDPAFDPITPFTCMSGRAVNMQSVLIAPVNSGSAPSSWSENFKAFFNKLAKIKLSPRIQTF